MDTTDERLKVGTQVIIGSYGVNNDEPHPVVWLKGNPNCRFYHRVRRGLSLL